MPDGFAGGLKFEDELLKDDILLVQKTSHQPDFL